MVGLIKNVRNTNEHFSMMVGMGMHGSVLEDQLNRLKEYENAVVGNKAIMEEMEKVHQAVQEAMIFENRSVVGRRGLGLDDISVANIATCAITIR